MRRRVETPRGIAWIEEHGLDMYWVYPEEDGRQMIGAILVVGREIDDLKYTWSAGEGDLSRSTTDMGAGWSGPPSSA